MKTSWQPAEEVLRPKDAAPVLSSNGGHRRSFIIFVLIFTFMAGGIAIIGHLSYRNYARQFRLQVENQLASIAQLKVEQLKNWRSERMGDIQVRAQNPVFAAQVQDFLANPDDRQTREDLQAWLDIIRRSSQYDRVFLLDTNGVERMSSPPTGEAVAAHLLEQEAAILEAGEVAFVDFHRDTENGPIYLAFLAPLYAKQNHQPLGIIGLRVNPNAYLYPFIQEWPVPNESAETLLIRREGEDVVFLNDLRFHSGAALNLRFSLNTADLPAAMVAGGQTGIVEGKDYRGVPVVAYVQPVPDSPWFVVSKMDTTEVYAPLRERLWQTIIFFGALILAGGAGLMVVWRQQRVRYYRHQAQAAEAVRQSESLLKEIAANYPHSYVSIIEKDLTIGFSAGQEFAKQNLDPKAFQGMKLEQVFGEQAEIVRGYYERTFRGEACSFELFINAQSQLYKTVPLKNQAGEINRILVVTENITERKQAEAEIKSARAFLEKVIDMSPFAMWISDREGTVTKVNRALCEMINLGEAEIIGKYNVFNDANLELQGVMTQVRAVFEQFQPARFSIPWQAAATGSAEYTHARDMYIAVSMFPILDSKGELTNVVCQWVDFTEQKEAENRLRDSEARFSTAFFTSPVAQSIITQESSEILAVNDTCCRLFEYSRAELVGASAAKLNLWENPADRQVAVEELRRTGHLRPQEATIRVKSGEARTVMVAIEPISWEGIPCLISSIFDITKRKRAEQGLQIALTKYQTLFEAFPLGITVADDQGGILETNATAEKILGISEQEQKQRNLDGEEWHIIRPDGTRMPAKEYASVRALREGQKIENMEMGILKPDGAVTWINVTAAPLPLEGYGVVVTYNNITRRKNAENRLSQSERNYRELVQNANSAIIRWKRDGTIAFFNEYAQSFFGYSSDEIIGQPVGILVPQTDSAGGNLSMLVQSIVEHPEQFVNMVNENICRDGRRVWLAWTNKPVYDENGQVAEILAVGSDITALRHAEEQLRASEAKFKAVFDNAPVGISLLDPKRNLTESNEMLAQIVRITKEGLAAGTYRSRKYIREDGSEIPTSELASTRAIAENRIVRDVVNGIILEDGGIIWTQVSAAPLGLPDHRIVVITQDITERKQAEAQLRITLEELRRSNTELEQFAYVASHDLQEPLRAVAGMVQLLQQRYQGQLDERADEYIRHAVEAAKRMQALIKDLLEFSRVERRGKPFEEVDSAVCVQAALRNLEVAVRESNAAITWDELPAITADSGQITQLFQNLLGNALKFRGEQTPQIHIGVQKLPDAWQFSVRDNGIGIEAQYFERIFLVFQRLHTRNEYAGTGIGLALCKKIIERHGGSIWVESEPGQGATFHFAIPFRSTP